MLLHPLGSSKNNVMVLAQIAPKYLLCLLITFVVLVRTAAAQEQQSALRGLERARDAAERLEYTGILITQ